MYNYSIAFKYAGEEREAKVACSVELTSETFPTILKDFASFAIDNHLRSRNLQKEGLKPFSIRIYLCNEAWEKKKEFYQTADLRD